MVSLERTAASAGRLRKMQVLRKLMMNVMIGLIVPVAYLWAHAPEVAA